MLNGPHTSGGESWCRGSPRWPRTPSRACVRAGTWIGSRCGLSSRRTDVTKSLDCFRAGLFAAGKACTEPAAPAGGARSGPLRTRQADPLASGDRNADGLASAGMREEEQRPSALRRYCSSSVAALQVPGARIRTSCRGRFDRWPAVPRRRASVSCPGAPDTALCGRRAVRCGLSAAGLSQLDAHQPPLVSRRGPGLHSEQPPADEQQR